MSKQAEALGRVRDLPDNELAEALERAQDELFRMRLNNYTNQLQNPLSVRFKRREVARIMTVIQERKASAASNAGKEV